MSEHSHGSTNGTDYSVQNSHFNQFREPTRNNYVHPGGVTSSPVGNRIAPGGQSLSPSSVASNFPHQNHQRGMSGSGIQPQGGSTPTLNQLLQNPNANQRYPSSSSYGDFNMGQQKEFVATAGSHNYASGHDWPPMQQNPINPYQSQMPGNQNFRNQGPMYNNRPPMNQGYAQQHGCYGQFSPTSQRFPSNIKQGNPSVSQGMNHQMQPNYGQQSSFSHHNFPSSQHPNHQISQLSPSQPSPHPTPPPSQQLPNQISPAPAPPHSSSSGPTRTSSVHEEQTQHPSSHNENSAPPHSNGIDTLKEESNDSSVHSFKQETSQAANEEQQPQQHSNNSSNLNNSNQKPTVPSDPQPTAVSQHHLSIQRPIASPAGSTGSRSNTPASLSGNQAGSPMPPRPPSNQVDGPGSRITSSSPMSSSAYNMHMMPPPPMGPNQMSYSGQGKMPSSMMGGPQMNIYNQQYPGQQGSYSRGMPGYGNQPSMNGPSQMGGNPMYGGNMNRGMPGGGSYPSQYGPQGGMPPMSGQYGQYPGQNSMGPNAGKMPPGGPGMPPSHPPSSMMGQNSSGVVPPHSSSVGSGMPPNAPSMGMNTGMGSNANLNATPSVSSYGGGSQPSHGIAPNTSVNQSGDGGPSVSKSSPALPSAPTPSQNTGTPSRIPGAADNLASVPKAAQAAAQAAMMAAKNQSQHNSRAAFDGNQPMPSGGPPAAANQQGPIPPRSMNPPQQGGMNNPMMGHGGMETSGHSAQMGGYNITGGPPQNAPSQPAVGNGDMSDGNSSNSRNFVPGSISTHDTSIPRNSNMPPNMAGNNSYGMPPLGPGSSMNGMPAPHMSRNTLLPPNTVAPPSNGPQMNSTGSSVMGTNMGPPPMGHHHMGPPHSVPGGNSGHFMKPPDMAPHMDNANRVIEDSKHDVKPPGGISVANSISGTFESMTTQSTAISSTPSIVASSMSSMADQKVIKTEEPSSQDESSQDSVKIKLEPKKEVNKQEGSSQHEDVESVSSPSWPGTPNPSSTSSTTTPHQQPQKAVNEVLQRQSEMGDEPGRRPWLERLFEFMADRGSPIQVMPTISKNLIDIYKLYILTKEKGGLVEVTKQKKWREISGALAIGTSSSAGFTLKKNYCRLIFPFECKYELGNIDPSPILAQVEAPQKKDSKRAGQDFRQGYEGYGMQHPGMPSDMHQAQMMPPNVGMMPPNSGIPPHYGQQGMMGSQGMIGNQGMMGSQGGMMGSQGMMVNQGGMMGNQGMMGSQSMMANQGMMGSQGGMMGSQSGMMGSQGMMEGGQVQGGMMPGQGVMGNQSMMPQNSGMVPNSSSNMPNTSMQSQMMANRGMPNHSNTSGGSNMYGETSFTSSEQQQSAASRGFPTPSSTPSSQASTFHGGAPNSMPGAGSNSMFGFNRPGSTGSAPTPPVSSAAATTTTTTSGVSQGTDSVNNTAAATSYPPKTASQESFGSQSGSGPPFGNGNRPPSQASNSDNSNQGMSTGIAPSSTPPIPRSQTMMPPSSQLSGQDSTNSTSFPSRFGSPQHTPLQRPPTPQDRSSTPQNQQPPSQQPPVPQMQTPGQLQRPPFTGGPTGGMAQGQENSYGSFPHAGGPTGSPSPSMYQGNKPGMYKPRPDFPRRDPSFSMQNMRHDQWSAMQQQRYGSQTNSPMPPNPSSMGPQVGGGNIPPNTSMPPTGNMPPMAGVPPTGNIPQTAGNIVPVAGMRPPTGVAMSGGNMDGSWKPPGASSGSGMPSMPPGSLAAQTPSTPQSYSGGSGSGGVGGMYGGQMTRMGSSQSMTPHRPTPKMQSSKSVSSSQLPKREITFPSDSVEATTPHLNKRKRLSHKHTGQVDPWRLMMALRSGLLMETSWALDVLSILLFDDSTVVYFGLQHLPGLLDTLLDHFKCYLIQMFGQEFEELEIKCTQCMDMPALEQSCQCGSVAKAEPGETLAGATKSEPDLLPRGTKRKLPVELPDEEKLRESGNYTLRTRCGKMVKIEEDSDDLDLVFDNKLWDKYQGFNCSREDFDLGKGDLTLHVKTHFESEHSFELLRKRFFRQSDLATRHKDSGVKKELVSSGERSATPPLLLAKCGENTEVLAGSPKENRLLLSVKVEKEEQTDDHCKAEQNSNCSSDSGIHVKSETSDCVSDTQKLEPEEVVHPTSSASSLVPEKPDRVHTPDSNVDVSKLESDNRELQDFKDFIMECNENDKKYLCMLKRKMECSDMDKEEYRKDETPLCNLKDSNEELSRRCVCVSNIIRSLSFIPGNDREMSRHRGLITAIGKVLLYQHKHMKRSTDHRTFDKEVDTELEDSFDDGVDQWWWPTLDALRENMFVVLANMSGQLNLSVFPEEICMPVLDGLLHWAVCPSAYAQDAMLTMSPNSVLSPQRLVLETLCKLCVTEINVDLILATPPFSRIVTLFSHLIKLLADDGCQVTQEFSVVLLSFLVQGDTSAARAIALQHPAISLLLDFIESAEQNAIKIVASHGVQALRENQDMVGTTPDMLRKAAKTLLHLAKVRENRSLFIPKQDRLLNLVMSQVLDKTVVSILSGVLLHCSIDG